MRTLLVGINHWLHLISAVIWIGGLGFMIMTLAPSLRGKFPHDSTKDLFQNIRKRYYRMAGILLLVILITGGFNFVVAVQGMEQAPRLWVILLGLKLALVTALGSIYLLNVLYKANPPEVGEPAVPYAGPSFVLGVLIILAAALLRHAH